MPSKLASIQDTKAVINPIREMPGNHQNLETHCSNPVPICEQSGEDDTSRIVNSTDLQVLLTATTIAVGVCILHPQAILAIEHPVDFGHLQIPNPLLEADPRFFISGGVCAAASHGITTSEDNASEPKEHPAMGSDNV